MKKKLLCGVMAAAMTLSSFSVFADDFKPSAANKGIYVDEYTTDNGVYVTDEMTKEEADNEDRPVLVINLKGLVDADETEIAQIIALLIDSTENGKLDAAAFAKAFGYDGDVSGYTNAYLFDVYANQKAKDLVAEIGSIQVKVKGLDLITGKSDILTLHKKTSLDNSVEKLDSVAEDKGASFAMTNFSPVLILVKGDAGNNQGAATGDMTAYAIGIMAIALAGAGFVAFRKKEQA